MNKKLVIALVVIIVIAISVAFIRGNGVNNLGASSGPEHFNRQFFRVGSTNGGVVATTTSAATYTTVAKDFNGTPSFWSITPDVNTTISLSGISTHAYVPNVGDTASVYVRNASTTAASTVTFAAADAGIDLQEDEGETVILNGLEIARLNFVRIGINTVVAWVELGQVGD